MPDPTTAPKPAATTAAPASPPLTGAPTTTPVSPTPPAVSSPGHSESPYDEIDRIAAGAAAPKSKNAPSKEAGPKDPTPPPSESDTDDAPSAEEPATAPGGDAKKDTNAPAAEKQAEKPVKAAELRAAYERLKKEHATLKTEHEKVKTAKPPEDPEKSVLLDRVKAFEEKISKLEEELKFSAFERSGEYKERYEKPFIDAYQAGRNRAASLKVTDAEGNVRAGTAQDFDFIMRIPDDDAAAERAAEMFGAKAPMVLFHRERVQEMNNARSRAIEEHRQHANERDRDLTAKQIQQRQEAEKQRTELTQTFQRLNTEAVEKYPHYFKPEDGDDKGNELLEKGFKLADMAFSGADGLPPSELVKVHSALRNKAAGFDRLAYKFQKAQAQVAELTKELEQFKKSVPGEDSARRGGEKKALSWEEEIDAVAR